MRDRLRLVQHFDPVLLQQDLCSVDTPEWVNHFVPAHYEGTWSVLPMRAPAGATHPIKMIYSDPTCEEFVDTPLLARCPNVRQVLANLQCPLQAVRLMKLAAGSVIKPHKDHDLDAESGHVRLHIPVVTNPDVDFRLNGIRVVMREGECWYLRLSDPHEVANRGVTDRVHLVIDALMNPWLAEQLALAESLQSRAIGAAEATPYDSQQSASAPTGPDTAPGVGWIPFRVRVDLTEPVVDWCYLGDTTFSDPFFEQTIGKLRHRLGQPAPRHTPIDTLLECQATRPGVPPTAFVFHVSRCGSTLFSRLAAALPDSIAISEAQVIDQVLRAQMPETRSIEWLRAVISALGQPRRGGERRMFVKFDAWHIAHLALVQSAFPGVPCVFLYREPAAVLASQLRMPGMLMISEGQEATRLGMASRDGVRYDREEHFAGVLGATYARAVPHAAAGQLTLINYNDLPETACTYLLRWCEMDPTSQVRDVLRQVAGFDAKEPSRPFDLSATAQPSQRAKEAAIRFLDQPYSALESIRRRQAPSEDQR